MPNFYKIPLSPKPQTFKITLGATDYRMTVTYQNTDEGGWVLGIADAKGNPLVNGIPLITGANLLEQYPHLGFTGRLWVQTSQDPDAVPTFTNLGTEAFLYWVTD